MATEKSLIKAHIVNCPACQNLANLCLHTTFTAVEPKMQPFQHALRKSLPTETDLIQIIGKMILRRKNHVQSDIEKAYNTVKQARFE